MMVVAEYSVTVKRLDMRFWLLVVVLAVEVSFRDEEAECLVERRVFVGVGEEVGVDLVVTADSMTDCVEGGAGDGPVIGSIGFIELSFSSRMLWLRWASSSVIVRLECGAMFLSFGCVIRKKASERVCKVSSVAAVRCFLKCSKTTTVHNAKVMH